MGDKILTPDVDLDIHCRADGPDKFIAGIVVPWNVPVKFQGYLEEFVQGAFDEQFSDGITSYVPLRYEHSGDKQHIAMPIGRLVETRSEKVGQWAEFRMGRGDLEREIWNKCDDRTLARMSIEFQNLTKNRPKRTGVGQGYVKRAKMTGTAITTKPIYDEAAIVAVRARLAPKRDEWVQYLEALNPPKDKA